MEGAADTNGPVSDGTLELQGAELELIPVPCRVCGSVAAHLKLSDTETLNIRAESMELRLLGEAVYVEQFLGDD